MSVITAPAPARPTPPADTAAPAASPRLRWRWVLLAGWLVHVCLRLWLARSRTVPVANADETGYLVAARWLTGGPGGDLTGHTFYQGGYGLLLMPAHLLSNDPDTIYRLAIGTNALVGAAVFPLAHLLLRRLGLTRPAAVPLAFAAALLPAVLVFGRYALADAILPVVVLGWLLALDRFVRNGSRASALIASLAAAYAYAVHSRGSVVLAVHVAALLWSVRRKPRIALPALAMAAVGYAAASSLNSRLVAELYPGGARDLGDNLVTRVTTWDGQAWALSGAAGQIWYLVACTWGLAGVGLVAAAVTVVRRGEHRFMAAVLLAVTGGIAYASSAALPDEHRVGNFAYGRYLACLAVVYTLIGLAALVRSRFPVRHAVAAAGLLAGTALWVGLYAGDRLRTHDFIGFDFPEIIFLSGEERAFRLTTATLVALALLGGFLALRKLGAPLLLIVNVAAAVVIIRPFGPLEPPSPPPLPGPAAGGVVTDISAPWSLKADLIHPVWWTRVGRFNLREGHPPPGVCTVVVGPGTGWPGHPAGWRSYPHRFGVAWRAPACP